MDNSTNLVFLETFSDLTSDEIVQRTKNKLSDFRFTHCVRTSRMAAELAVQNGVDENRAALAGFVHDYAKEISVEDYQKVIKEQKFDPDLLNWNRAIWHGIVGAYFVEKELHIHDQQILAAIRHHTTGSPDMSELDKVIFMADYIEPGRTFEGVDEARAATVFNLDAGVVYQLQHTLLYLISERAKVYPLTVATYNKLATGDDNN